MHDITRKRICALLEEEKGNIQGFAVKTATIKRATEKTATGDNGNR